MGAVGSGRFVFDGAVGVGVGFVGGFVDVAGRGGGGRAGAPPPPPPRTIGDGREWVRGPREVDGYWRGSGRGSLGGPLTRAEWGCEGRGCVGGAAPREGICLGVGKFLSGLSGRRVAWPLLWGLSGRWGDTPTAKS